MGNMEVARGWDISNSDPEEFRKEGDFGDFFNSLN